MLAYAVFLTYLVGIFTGIYLTMAVLIKMDSKAEEKKAKAASAQDRDAIMELVSND